RDLGAGREALELDPGVRDRRPLRHRDVAETHADHLVGAVVHQLEIGAGEIHGPGGLLFGVVGARGDADVDRSGWRRWWRRRRSDLDLDHRAVVLVRVAVVVHTAADDVDAAPGRVVAGRRVRHARRVAQRR